MYNTLYTINQCSSGEMSAFVSILKNILNLIQIIGPILLLISLVIAFVQLMSNPDEKKYKARIKNSLIGIIILFFIPLLVNVVMATVDNSYQISACWNSSSNAKLGKAEYVGDDKNKKKIGTDPSEYEKGEKKKIFDGTSGDDKDSTGNTDTDSQTGNESYGYSGPITGDLQIHFINPSSRVDAIYIKVGNQALYIDGGFKSDGKREIAYMDKIGVKKIDYYIGSHSHKNHVEAAPAVIKKYGVKTVFVGRETASGSGGDPASWYAIKKYANEQNVSLSGVQMKKLVPGDVINVGALKITCVGPISVTNGLAIGDTKQNYNALILRLDYGSTSFLLTGDNSSSSNWKASDKAFPGKLNVNVLKNAHHNGMNNESSYKLASAEYVVFLTDKKNLPSSSCINRIKKFGAKNYYVVADGQSENVVFTSNGNKIDVVSNYNP